MLWDLKEKHFRKSKLEFLLLIVKFLDPVAEGASRKLWTINQATQGEITEICYFKS